MASKRLQVSVGPGAMFGFVLFGALAGPVLAGQVSHPGVFDAAGAVAATTLSAASLAPTTGSVAITQDGATVTLTAFSEAGLYGLGAGTDLVIGQVAVSRATAGTSMLSIGYDFRINLTDRSGSSSATGALDIKGVLAGSITRTASGAMQYNVTNSSYPSPGPVTIGGEVYQFQASSFTPPSYLAGQFGAHVVVSPSDGIHTSAVPEPSTLVMAGIGLVGLIAASARRGFSPSPVR